MTTILQEAAAGRATIVPWTVERYRRAIETGFVPEDASVESCVIEVADSSLSLDVGPKLAAYAAARIPQYVVVDLVNHRVLVHEEPAGSACCRDDVQQIVRDLRLFAVGGLGR